MGHNLTNKQLEDALNSALDCIQSLSSKFGTLQSKHAEALDIINKLQNRLAYYENADSPPSARSLPSKKGSH